MARTHYTEMFIIEPEGRKWNLYRRLKREKGSFAAGPFTRLCDAQDEAARREDEEARLRDEDRQEFARDANQRLADAMGISRERECVKCECVLPVCCDTEDGPYCQTCCPCDHRKGGGIGGGDYQRTDVEV